MEPGQGRSGYYRIEVAARVVGLSRETVSYCVSEGLVRPAAEEQGAALFGEPELARLRKVRRLQEDLGVNLEGVEVVLRLLDEIAALRAELARHRGTR